MLNHKNSFKNMQISYKIVHQPETLAPSYIIPLNQ